MRSSCIRHPEREPLILIRKWQIEFCEGNKCAAALMSFLEYWHNIKLEQSYKAKKLNSLQQVRSANSDKPVIVDESLYQFHNTQELSDGIMGLYGEKKIKDSLDYLEDRQVISIHRNPNKRYGYDKTKYFIFYPDVVNNWLKDYGTPYCSHSAKTLDRSRKNTGLYRKNTGLYRKNTEPITEITTETTKEITSSDDGFSNFFKLLKSKEKKIALKEAEVWFQNLPDFKKEKYLRSIRAFIEKREILNEEAYTGACLYNMMMSEKEDPDYGELEFAMRMGEFIDETITGRESWKNGQLRN